MSIPGLSVKGRLDALVVATLGTPLVLNRTVTEQDGGVVAYAFGGSPEPELGGGFPYVASFIIPAEPDEPLMLHLSERRQTVIIREVAWGDEALHAAVHEAAVHLRLA